MGEQECEKCATFCAFDVCLEVIQKRDGISVVDTICNYMHATQPGLVVCGSVELANPQKKVFLGSVSQAVAKRCAVNVCVVKNFTFHG